ncbi:MAG: PQQ-binding-like beta-propeller repeat protein [Planctomycetota bacterium]
MQPIRCLGLSAAFLIVGSATTSAQGYLPRNPEIVQFAPRSLQRYLTEGKTAIEQERYTDGIASLALFFGADPEGIIADDVRGQDFFMESQREDANRERIYRSTLKGEALRLLADLPSAGRDVLEIQFGVRARQILDEAITSQDTVGIDRVAREYPFTNAGFDAQILIADRLMRSGSPLGAAHIYRELLGFRASRERFGVTLVQAACSSWIAGEKTTEAVESLVAGANLFPDKSIRLLDSEVSLTADGNWATIVEAAIEAERSKVNQNTSEDWKHSGAVPSRNVVSKLRKPITSDPKWVAKTHSNYNEGNLILAQDKLRAEQKSVVLPKNEVRSVGDLVLLKTNTSEIRAIDLDTGRIQWAYYKNSAPVNLGDENSWRSGLREGQVISTELKRRVWGSDAFGKFSCDDQRFYYITEAKLTPKAAGGFSTYGSLPRANELRAVSIDKEGAIEWMVGTDTLRESQSIGAEELQGAFFLGPPLPYKDSLYCIVELRGDIHLIVLSSSTGDLQWRQQLCSPSNYDSQLERQYMALSPTISEGVIVCPTGTRGVVAVDLVTRNLRWLVNYRQQNTNQPSNPAMLAITSPQKFESYASRWHENLTVAEGGLVALTTIDGDALMVRSVIDGTRVFNRSRSKAQYLAGISGNRAYVVFGDSVACVNMESEQTLWRTSFPGQLLAGKGLWLTDGILIPLTGNLLIRIDLQGEIQERLQFDEPLGSLFARGGNLLSVTSTSVTAFRSEDELKRSVESLENEEQSVASLNSRAQFEAYAMNNTAEAVRLIRKSYDIDPANSLTQSYLVEFLLKGLEEDLDAFYDDAKELQDVFANFPKQVSLLQKLAMGSIARGEVKASFEGLVRFINKRLSDKAGIPGSRREKLKLSTGYQVDIGVWTRAALERSYNASSPEDRSTLDLIVQREVAEAGRALFSQQMLVLSYFDWHPAAQQLLIRSAVDLINDRQRLGAEQVRAEEILLQLVDSPSLEIRKSAESLMAQLTFEDTNYFGRRGKIIDSVVGMDGALQNLEPADDPDMRAGAKWNKGNLLFGEVPKHLSPSGQRINTVSKRFGRPEIDVRLSINELILANMNGPVVDSLRYPRATSDHNNAMLKARILGGLLLIETSSELAAFDIYRGMEDSNNAMLWRQSMRASMALSGERFEPPRDKMIRTAFGAEINLRSEETNGLVGPMSSYGIVLHRGAVISCINPYTGRELWQRDGYQDKCSIALRDEELAIVCPEQGFIEYLDMRDGSELGRPRRPIEEGFQHWFAGNQLIVDYKQIETGESISADGLLMEDQFRVEFKIWSPWEDEPRLHLQKLKPDTCASICEDRYLVIADQAGKIHMLDLETEKYTVLDAPIDQELVGLHTFRFGNRLVVASKARLKPHESSALSVKNPDHQDLVLVNGYVYCINLDDHTFEWAEPAQLFGMYIPISQPRSAPFLFSFRLDASDNLTDESARIALLDLRDGKLASAESNIDFTHSRIQNDHSFALEYNPRTQAIHFLLRNKYFVFRCLESELPPRPAAHFGTFPADDQQVIELRFN